MKTARSWTDSSAALREHTGIVIPAYLPKAVNNAAAIEMLEATVRSFVGLVATPANVCISVDGPEFGAAEAGEIAKATGAALVVSPSNRGKLQAATAGMQQLLKSSNLHYFAVVDQDGDHFANELLNLVRACRHIEDEAKTNKILINGRRISLHRPMGLLRGELEDFVDRILFDALTYDAATCGQPMRLEFSSLFGDVPDFHSGYKLFSRATAADVFQSAKPVTGVTDDCHWRHSVEVVMVVEALAQGAILGQVNRSTFNEQPISTFGLYNRAQLYADNIIWPCTRLAIPPTFIEQWMRNHASRLDLNTLAPQGRDEVTKVIAAVRSHFGIADSGRSGEVLFV